MASGDKLGISSELIALACENSQNESVFLTNTISSDEMPPSLFLLRQLCVYISDSLHLFHSISDKFS